MTRLSMPNWPMMVAILTWAVNFVALKMLYREVEPASVSLVRCLLMWVSIAIICLVQGESLKFPKENAFRINLQGFLSLGLYMVIFLEGLARTGGAEGAILLSTSPIWTSIFAVLAKQEKFRLPVIIGALVAFAGVGLIVTGRSPEALGVSERDHLIGIGLMLGSAIVWAWSTVISRPLLKSMTPLRLLAVSMPAALLILVPYGWQSMVSTPWQSISGTGWLTLTHVTFLAGVAGFIGFYAGVRKIGASGAMLYQYLVPPLAALLEWAIFGRSLTWIQFLGFLVVILGISVASWGRQSQPQVKPEPEST